MPKDIESGAHTLRKGIISVQGPDQERAKNGLAKDVRDVAGSEVLTNFAALLANGDEFGDKSMPASLVAPHGFADSSAREVGEQHGANDGGIAARLLRHANGKSAKELGERLGGGAQMFNDGLQFGELHVGKGQKQVIFAREIVEEGAFAEIGGVGDVFDGGVGEAALGKKVEG